MRAQFLRVRVGEQLFRLARWFLFASVVTFFLAWMLEWAVLRTALLAALWLMTITGFISLFLVFGVTCSKCRKRCFVTWNTNYADPDEPKSALKWFRYHFGWHEGPRNEFKCVHCGERFVVSP